MKKDKVMIKLLSNCKFVIIILFLANLSCRTLLKSYEYQLVILKFQPSSCPLVFRDELTDEVLDKQQLTSRFSPQEMTNLTEIIKSGVIVLSEQIEVGQGALRRTILILDSRKIEPHEFSQPQEGSVIFFRDGGYWKQSPFNVKLSDKKIKIHQSSQNLNQVVAEMESETGTNIFIISK